MDFIYTDDGVDLALMGITGAYDVKICTLMLRRIRLETKRCRLLYEQVVGGISIDRVPAGAAQKSFGVQV